MDVKNYINGRLQDSLTAASLENIAPATGEVYGTVPASGTEDVKAAIVAARSGKEIWAQTSVEERAHILRKIATVLENRQEQLAEAESIDTGKPLKLAARVDIPRSILNFRFFADALTQFASECHVKEATLNYTLRHPLGIVACISPWNLPLYLLTWKIAPALAAGNAVIAKPSEITPVTAHLLSEVCIEAGLPAGVLQILHGKGSEVGTFLVENPQIKAVSFTGSTATGAEISRRAAPLFKKLSLELGGKNPTLIFSDCDFERTVEMAVKSAFTNQGEICLCGSRILIEKSMYEKFKEVFLQQVRQLKVGDPQEDATDQGAVVSKAHFDKILYHIGLAKEEGGKILCGGEAVKLSGRCKNGFFVAPTVIENLSPQCRTNQEEIFGPVVTLLPFQNDHEAIAIANSTPYGLAASIFTSNLDRAHQLSAKLQSGIVWVNTWMNRDLRTPFGGMKNSGLGREGGFEALRFFTEPQNICIQLGVNG